MHRKSLINIFLIVLVIASGKVLAKKTMGGSKSNWEIRQEALITTHQNRHIERLVFTSGGVKGSVYPGVLKALETAQILPQVEKVSGSSAGAIIAAFLAVGIDINVLYNDFLSTNFIDLLGEDVGSFLGGNKEGVSFFTKDGDKLLEHARLLINNSIRTFLSSKKASPPNNNKVLSAFAERFKASERLSFGDLAQLHQLYPDTFKDLTILSVLFPTGEVRVFNAHETPEIEIAQAIRASSSIPGIFEPFALSYKNKAELHCDGALYELLPADYFDRAEDGSYIKNQKPENTLLFAFADNAHYHKSSLFKALHSTRADEDELKRRYSNKTSNEPRFFQPGFVERIIRNGFVDYFGDMKAPYTHPERWDRAYYDVYSRYHHNTVGISNGEVRALDFAAGTKWARELFAIGFIDTMAYLIAHDLFNKSSFKPSFYYPRIVNTFNTIYADLLREIGIIHDDDDFSCSLQRFNKILHRQIKHNDSTILMEQRYYFIRDSIRNNFNSLEAFALSRAVEKSLNFIDEYKLQKEIKLKAGRNFF